MPSPKPHIILVDGKSGVGKSRLAARIANSLGAGIVHLDDAYRGWNGLAEGRDAIIEDILVQCAKGMPGHYRAWDWERDIDGDLRDVPLTDVIVIEGCGISTAQSRELASTVMWVECDEHDRLARLADRDGSRFAEFYDVWEAQVESHITHNDPIATATVVVRT